jgi:uncharacterized protein YeaO (DUF488 family)
LRLLSARIGCIASKGLNFAGQTPPGTARFHRPFPLSPMTAGYQGESSMSGKIPADHIRLKRAYEPPAADDGTRILVDRLWPRRVKKTDAAIDEWMKEIAPSTPLRKWFGHDSARWPEFRRRYKSEIREHADELERLHTHAQRGRITLVFAAHSRPSSRSQITTALLCASSICPLSGAHSRSRGRFAIFGRYEWASVVCRKGLP